MLSIVRGVKALVVLPTQHVAPAGITNVQKRNAATLQELKRRVKTVRSIGKITKAMKMVASSKLRMAQELVDVSRVFAAGMSNAWKEPEEREPVNRDGNILFVTLCTDRGLCGGVNSAILRKFKPILRKLSNSKTKMILIGDKGRSGLDREFSKYFDVAYGELSRVKRLTFTQVAMVADKLVGYNFDYGQLIYNKFINTSSYEPVIVPLTPLPTMLAQTDIGTKYENEGDDSTYRNFYEYRMACRLFNQSCESFASETASRMNAMSSSSKNAAEMLQNFSLQYNRQRQAKITGELIEIMSGAAAAEAQNKAEKDND